MARYGVVFSCTLRWLHWGMFCLKTSLQVNGDGRSLPVQHLVVTTWNSDQFTLNQPGMSMLVFCSRCFLVKVPRLQPCGLLGAREVEAMGKTLAEDGICWLGEGKMWAIGSNISNKAQSWDIPSPPPHPPKKYLQLSENH